MRRFWLEDPARRAFTIAVVCSILLHILLLASLVWVNRFNAPMYAKRGEPLIVDIAPDKPEEKAPLGSPAQPPGPPPPKVAKAPAPKAKLPPAPPARPPAVAKAAPPPPEPPKQAARAAPPEPEARARETAPPQPSPPQVPAPQPSPQPQEARPAPTPSAAEATRSQPAPTPAPSEGVPGRTALAKPPAEAPSIFRSPGGGGGLHGGRGGNVGEPIPLDTPDPNYREYMEKVRRRIYANWGYPYEAQQRGLQGKLVIEFHIAKDGHLQFIDLRQTSGEEILDSFAMTAVKLAQVYPPLPDAMHRDVLPVVGVFIYTLRGPLSVLQSLH